MESITIEQLLLLVFPFLLYLLGFIKGLGFLVVLGGLLMIIVGFFIGLPWYLLIIFIFLGFMGAYTAL